TGKPAGSPPSTRTAPLTSTLCPRNVLFPDSCSTAIRVRTRFGFPAGASASSLAACASIAARSTRVAPPDPEPEPDPDPVPLPPLMLMLPLPPPPDDGGNPAGGSAAFANAGSWGNGSPPFSAYSVFPSLPTSCSWIAAPPRLILRHNPVPCG